MRPEELGTGAEVACAVSAEAMSRFTRAPRSKHWAARKTTGPEFDIPAPDVGTNAQIMVWIMDTFMNVVGFDEKNAVRRVVTGKTITSGGSHGRDTATGMGIVHCVVEWAKDRRFDLNG